jgi:hypothetical protein
MDTNETPRVTGIAENEPAGQRQRLPWHAPQLIKEAVQHLTGSHARSSGGDVRPASSSIS